MNTPPLISVLIPAYNGEPYLADAINSVLAQNYRPIEIIVIDDGSTDGTASIAQSFQDVRYTYQTNGGISVALNHGIELAAGDYFSFLDADDLWTPNKLLRQMQCFEYDAALDMVFGHMQQFYDIPDGVEGQNVSPPVEGYFKGTLLISRTAFFLRRIV
jgi:glycosyltransferase involved in cell wall biosynthesis